MNSVERLVHYIDTVEQEKSATSPSGQEPPASWPEKGQIQFNGVQMRYRKDKPLVLKGLTFEVKPSEKIGVVGRTGAGERFDPHCE